MGALTALALTRSKAPLGCDPTMGVVALTKTERDYDDYVGNYPNRRRRATSAMCASRGPCVSGCLGIGRAQPSSARTRKGPCGRGLDVLLPGQCGQSDG